MIVSCAISADGYLDDASGQRLILSGPADLDQVDELRASCDAILVGAGTIRADNPRLRLRDPRRRARRIARGLPEHPLRVTLTSSGNLDPSAYFFDASAPHVVYRGPGLSLPDVFAALRSERAVARLLVEGGSDLAGQVLMGDLANELRLAVAPVFVADSRAPRFTVPGAPPSGPMTPVNAERAEDTLVLRYLLGPGGADGRFCRWAIELSRQAPPSLAAFSVGAVIVAADGTVLGTGYSRQQQSADHAEEVALRVAGPDPRLRGATLYSSLIPCAVRASRPVTCVQHVIAAGIGRVVYAWEEPPVFVPGASDSPAAGLLRAAGIEVIQPSGLAADAAGINKHLL